MKTFTKYFAEAVEKLNTFEWSVSVKDVDAITKVVFPDSLKIANITPAHKKNEPINKENYRPVSLLPLLPKVFERLLYDQLSKYLEK